MKTISSKYRGPKIIKKKSRFIATVFPVSTREEIATALQEIQIEMKKATHNAYAYRILEYGKLSADFHDDGEVPSTAGQPILNALEYSDLINALLVVTRYYGGINLGKGGLIRAYGGTARDLLQHIPLEVMKNTKDEA